MSRVIYAPRETRAGLFKKRQWGKQRGPARAGKFSRIKLFIALGIIILLLGGVFYIIRLPKFQLSEIEFQGLTALSSEELKDTMFRLTEGVYLFAIPRRALFFISPSRLGERLKKEYPRIEDVEISRRFPNRLWVVIKERIPWAIFCVEGKSCAYIDSTGFAMEESPDTQGSLIRKINALSGAFEIGDRALDPLLMDKLLMLGERTERTLESKVVKYEVEHPSAKEVKLYVDEGFYLIFLRDDDFDNAFRVLKKILEGEIKGKRAQLEYIDLRFGNKVFYKFKGG